MSEAQIAATLGCSPGTVKSQANKAISKLRNALQPTPPAPTAEESPCPI
jgi:DNA-directed RNA polymerase specialized sigma24 family protein